MKTLNAIVKVVTALAAVAGAVYIIATYGEQIVAWAKKILSSLPKCPCCEKAESAEEAPVAEEPVPAEEAPAEEAPAPAEEAPAEEPAPEVVVAENEPTAEDKDFAE